MVAGAPPRSDADRPPHVDDDHDADHEQRPPRRVHGCGCDAVSRITARHAMKTLATTRNAASASAARCSAFPCPYWWPGSAGRTATPTAKNVRSAATRSVPEWIASETSPRLWRREPRPELERDERAARRRRRRARCAVAGSSRREARQWRRRYRHARAQRRLGGQMSASCRSERWHSGSPESSNGEIDVSSISASAGRSSHWSWCISARSESRANRR